MPNKKKVSPLDLIADKVACFMGSWLGVAFHLIWWLIWLVFKLEINVLTLWLSMEAILIGMFILMVQNQGDKDRHELLNTYNKSEMETLERDVKLAERGERRQLEIMRAIRVIQADLVKLKKRLAK